MNTVYVLSYAPDLSSTSGTGGFIWFSDKENAVREFAGVNGGRRAEDDTYDYMLRTVRVPPNLHGEELDHWIQERPELWDVPSVPTDPFAIFREYTGGEDGQWNLSGMDWRGVAGQVVHNDPVREFFVVESEWGVDDTWAPEGTILAVPYSRVIVENL